MKESVMEIQISSPAFREGEAIPAKYTCDGEDLSPPLDWHQLPPNTQSLALICEDPDAPSGVFVHWIIFNLPTQISHLPEAVPAMGTLEEGGTQGHNDLQRLGHSGPCPPQNGPHRYFFRLHALDIQLQLGAGTTMQDFARAIQ